MKETEEIRSSLRRMVLLIMHRSMHGLIGFSHERGLSMSQLASLFQIHRSASCGVGDVAKRLGISNAASSQLLDKLVQQQLVERSEDPQDRRGKRLRLTETGKRLLEESMEARQGWVDSLAEGFSPEERSENLKTLNLLIAKLEALALPGTDPCRGPTPKGIYKDA
jgi:DNA-binding MarR family transcriptional regulator